MKKCDLTIALSGHRPSGSPLTLFRSIQMRFPLLILSLCLIGCIGISKHRTETGSDVFDHFSNICIPVSEDDCIEIIAFSDGQLRSSQIAKFTLKDDAYFSFIAKLSNNSQSLEKFPIIPIYIIDLPWVSIPKNSSAVNFESKTIILPPNSTIIYVFQFDD